MTNRMWPNCDACKQPHTMFCTPDFFRQELQLSIARTSFLILRHIIFIESHLILGSKREAVLIWQCKAILNLAISFENIH